MLQRLKDTVWAIGLIIRIFCRGFDPRAAIEKDLLTGVLKREFILNRREKAIDRVKRTGGFATFVMLDLDGFKKVNDRQGHAAGDELLANVGEVLRECVRVGDFVGRIGGDEFLLILVGANPAEAEDIVAKRLAAELERRGICFSYGIYHFNWKLFLDWLVIQADAAMYRNKRERKQQRI